MSRLAFEILSLLKGKFLKAVDKRWKLLYNKKGELPYWNTIALHRSEASTPIQSDNRRPKDIISYPSAFFKRFFEDRLFCDGILSFTVPSTSRFGTDFLFSVSKCSLWSSPNEIKGERLPLLEQRETKKSKFHAAEDGIGRKTVSLSERAAEGQRKGEYGCRRALPSGSDFGRTYCRRSCVARVMHERRLF